MILKIYDIVLRLRSCIWISADMLGSLVNLLAPIWGERMEISQVESSIAWILGLVDLHFILLR